MHAIKNSGTNSDRRLELALVMPVYNEQDCISDVVRSWRDVLSSMGIEFRMIVLNDGSRDATGERLRAFSGDPRVEIVDKQNSGHGPTILLGYRMAVRMADWVFQCDSDNEMGAEHFPGLWRRRDGNDAVLGYRAGRVQGVGRKVISAVSRATVRMLFGGGIIDVNTPYRLIRSDVLAPIVGAIPVDTFAPNVVISGVLGKARLRVLNIPVPHRGRKTGSVSIVRWKLWRYAIRSFVQTVGLRTAMSGIARGFRDAL